MIINATLIILMSITFILVFLFVKTIDKRKWLTFLVSIVLTPLIYFYAVYPMINIFSNYHHKKYFKTALWIEKPGLRYELTDDMLDSQLLSGKTKSDVESLLGIQEWYTWDSIQNQHDQDKWNYSLGQEPGAFNDQKECLEIAFENNKVIATTIYQEQITFDEDE
ncbi:MAG: hypothetical protein HRU26_14980 [Psychroserpens sp.]|nr:hypothetical protein [Psychroserpens sp.]